MKPHREYVREQRRNRRLAKALDEANAESRLAVMLARMREHRGLTQRQLADIAGVRQPQIARIESGAYFPNLDTLWKLADALDATVQIGPCQSIQIKSARRVSRR